MFFKHPDADTVLLSAYVKVRTRNYTGTVILDCEDTNEWLISRNNFVVIW